MNGSIYHTVVVVVVAAAAAAMMPIEGPRDLRLRIPSD